MLNIHLYFPIDLPIFGSPKFIVKGHYGNVWQHHIEVDDMLTDILINLADSYPQAPISGGTPKMKDVITEINRVDDEENDFIFTSGIRIGEFME